MSESLNKEKKKGYDSDEDEGNPLVIEEEDDPMQPDEPQSETDEAGIQKTKDVNTKFYKKIFYFYGLELKQFFNLNKLFYFFL